jgi:iron complex transport system substrate-binding protein
MRMIVASSFRPRLLALASVLFALALPSSLAAVGSITAVDSMGRSLSLSAPARRIVSLSPEATESLYAIGAGKLMVGDTDYCDYPAEAKTLAKIGGFSADTISVEKIVALRPDLVVTAGTIHQPVEAALSKLGVPIFAYLPTNFAAIEEEIRALGRLAGLAEQGRAVADTLHGALEKARSLTASLPDSRRPRVFWQVYDEPLMTCGADSFPHQVIELAGGRDIFSDLPGPWPVVSAEEVLRRSPQVILSPDDMGDKVDPVKLASRPGWAAIPAVRDKKIALLSANLVSRAGPRIVEGVLAALKVLHPELFH